MTTAPIKPRPNVPGQLPYLDIPKIEPHHLQMSVFLKGPSGVGKTRLAHTFPEPILSIYTDANKETVLEMQRLGKQIEAYRVTEWDQFAQRFLPAIVNRQVPASTIVIDTYDSLFTSLTSKFLGRSRDARQDWGDILNNAQQRTYELTSATSTTADHPGYNIVVTCHTRKITDEQGNVTSIAPLIRGQFGDYVEFFFDYVLICDRIQKSIAQHGAPALKKNVYRILSVPPDTLQNAKAPSYWPSIIEIPEDEEGYTFIAKLRESHSLAPPAQSK